MIDQINFQRLHDRVYRQRLALKHERADAAALEVRMRKTVSELAHSARELDQATRGVQR